MANRPVGRQKTTVGGTGSVKKRGSGLGTGPVGSGPSHNGRDMGARPIAGNSAGGSQTGGRRRGVVRGFGGGGGKLFGIIAVVVLFLIFRNMFGSGASVSQNYPSSQNTQNQSTEAQSGSFGSDVSTSNSGSASSAMSGGASSMSSLFDVLMSGYSTTPSDFGSYSTGGMQNYNSYSESNSATLDTSVANGARAKRTNILGRGADIVTIMVYMCGTDLESKNGMATSDLQEMASATISDDVNLIVYTGGCKSWRNNLVSSNVNQIYQIKSGGMKCLESNMGNAAMTDPDNLTTFIKYCNKNFPANRNELIFWDHGSGSISGFGYDEKNPQKGSMSLAGINTALKNAGCTFDFIGFDACLMSTIENALMLTEYADYLIGSEETEPGVGWYYTNWLTKLSENTSMPTIEIGKNIVDDFVDVCARKTPGQKCTLAVTDLAELELTAPDKFKDFSASTADIINEGVEGFKKVSDARYNSKEFAVSSKIDQIDLVHFAKLIDTEESRSLVDALDGAVKYNRTSTGINNAYGLSVYFPYRKASKVKQVVNTYDQIGLDSEYSKCIEAFAKTESSGQLAPDGAGSPMGSLFGELYGTGGYSTGSSQGSTGTYADALGMLLGTFMGRSADLDKAAPDMIFDDSNLKWVRDPAGYYKIAMSEEQWDLVEGLDLNVFYDDGEGYIDLGLDNLFDYDAQGNVIGDYDNTWMSVNGQVVAYYHTTTEDTGNGYTISGYIPAFLNGDRVELQVVFDDEHQVGYISGARYVYPGGETDSIAKDMAPLQAGDKLDFICDYYDYNGNYTDSYYLGDQMTVGDRLELGNIDIGEGDTVVTYLLTDIYQQQYWTPAVP